MRADVQQVITLAYHAAASVITGETGPEMLSHSEAFGKVHAVEFVRAGALHGGKVAESVSPWFRRLRAEGVVMVRPLLGPLSIQTTPADSHAWGVLTDGDRGIELWRPTWKSRIAGYSDERPYRVSYLGDRIARWNVPPAPNAEESRSKLLEAIRKVLDEVDPINEPETYALVERCALLLERKVASFGQSAFIWPVATRSPESSAVAVATKCALLNPTLLKTKGVHRESVEKMWAAVLQVFEASDPTHNMAAAA